MKRGASVNILDLINKMEEYGASDLHIQSGKVPKLRVQGRMVDLNFLSQYDITFDTYDENILINGEHNIRTYAFISLKKKDRKNPTYTYSYFIIQNTIEKNMHLHPINLDLGNSEPIGLKIAKIYHKDENSIQKCFEMSSLESLQLKL